MIGVASSAMERLSGDPLANLERLIKENSEVQAGNFQLQHEMRAALAERNVMLCEMCEVVEKEKEMVEILADRCKKVEQQHTVMEWISRTLNQVSQDRTEKKFRMSEVESNIAKHVALVEDLKDKFSKLRIETAEVQCQRDSARADIYSVQMELESAISFLHEIHMKSQKTKTELFMMHNLVEKKNAEIHSLQQSVSGTFYETFSSRAIKSKQIEELDLDSENLEKLNVDVEACNTQLTEIKARILEFQQLIQKHDMIEAELLQTKNAIIDFCDSLEISTNLVASALDEKRRLTQDLLDSVGAAIDLVKKSDSLQEDLYRLRESQNGFIETSEMYQNQIMSILQEVAQCESVLQDKQNQLDDLVSQKRDLLQRQSQAKADLYNTVCLQLECQLESVRKLDLYNKQCRHIMLELKNSKQWDQLRRDLTDLENAYSTRIKNDDYGETDLIIHYDVAIQTCAESYRLASEIDDLELEFTKLLSKFQQLSEDYHSNMDELRTGLKEKNELSRQLANRKNEAEQNKTKFATMINEKAARYERRIEEEQSSEICDLSSISKEVLDEMNNRKQQQARKFNERMNEIQSQIDSALSKIPKPMNSSEQDNVRSETRMKKLLPKQTTIDIDPWIFE